MLKNVAFLLFIFVSSYATEISLNPLAGFNITNTDNVRMDSQSFDGKVGFIGGIELPISFTPLFGLRTGILYCQQGYQLDLVDLEAIKVNLDYLTIPCFATFSFGTHRIKPSIYTGTTVGFLLRDDITAPNEFADARQKNVGANSVDVGLTVGGALAVGLGIGALTIDARFTHGVTPVFEGVEDDYLMLNKSFSTMIGYKIPLNRTKSQLQ